MQRSPDTGTIGTSLSQQTGSGTSVPAVRVLPQDYRHVTVTSLVDGRIGIADKALRDRRVSAPEREAIRNVVQAVAYFRQRHHRQGADDAGGGVQLVLDTSPFMAPSAEPGVLYATASNPFLKDAPGRPPVKVSLPFDVALHEYTHVVQFAEARSDDFNHATGEGMADAVAVLATHDWRVGEGYFDPKSKATTLRDLSARHAPGALDPTTVDYREVRTGKVEEHEAGGLLAHTFYRMKQRGLSWTDCETLMYALLTDRQMWKRDGSFPAVARSLDAHAVRLWGTKAPEKLARMRAGMKDTHLDEAARERGVREPSFTRGPRRRRAW